MTTYPIVCNSLARAKIVYVYPGEPGIVWEDYYPDIATAQRNLRHYTRPAQVVPMPATCQHGAEADTCRYEQTEAVPPRHWWDGPTYVTVAVCAHHPQAAR